MNKYIMKKLTFMEKHEIYIFWVINRSKYGRKRKPVGWGL